MMLVSIEGIDKAGKSTVIEQLQSSLPDTHLTTEPNEDHWLGRVARRGINDDDINPLSTFHLLLADHHTHYQNQIEPYRDDNIVICDRYVDSRFVYQSVALNDVVSGETLDWIETVQQAGDSTLPDLTLLLDISVEEHAERADGAAEDKFEKKEFLREVRSRYLSLADRYTDRFVVVDAERPPEEVVAECQEHIQDRLEREGATEQAP